MKDWRWEDRYNPYYQLRFLVLQDKQHFDLIKWSNDELVKFAFVLAMYNGGQQGILNDRILCKSQGGDYNNWFGEKGVSNYSWKSKIKIAGYGKSFFEINREYVSNILKERRFRYITYWNSNE
jgi:membrane-bound lytic murein transglycosylase MltF